MKRKQSSLDGKIEERENAHIERVAMRIVGKDSDNVSRWREYLAYAVAFCMGFFYAFRKSLKGLPDRIKKLWQNSRLRKK